MTVRSRRSSPLWPGENERSAYHDQDKTDGRLTELRPIQKSNPLTFREKFAEGSCLIQCGDTMVLCCASVEDRVPSPMCRRAPAG